MARITMISGFLGLAILALPVSAWAMGSSDTDAADQPDAQRGKAFGGGCPGRGRRRALVGARGVPPLSGPHRRPHPPSVASSVSGPESSGLPAYGTNSASLPGGVPGHRLENRAGERSIARRRVRARGR